MKNVDLFTAVGDIDDSLIERSYISMNRPPKRGTNVRRVMIAAACAVALAAAVTAALFVAYRESASPITPGTSSDTTTDPAKDEQPGFVIKDGTLLEYTGADTEIVIPETVTTISANAFTTNANAQNVTAVFLGSSVENIEPLALAPLTSLETVEVEDDNEFFEVAEGVLLKKDGTYVLASIGAYMDYHADLFSHLITDETIQFRDYGYLEIGNILIQVDTNSESGYITARKISVYGQTVELFGEDEFQISGNIKFSAFETDKYAVIANSGYYSGEAYVFSKDGYVHIERPVMDEDDLDAYECESGITFFKQDGKLYYQRIPLKFQWRVHQVYGGVMDLCVSRNELYRESGRAEIENGEIVYYPEKSETVSDAFDLEEEYSHWQEVWRDSEDNNISELTLDEYLAQNAKIHKRAY